MRAVSWLLTHASAPRANGKDPRRRPVPDRLSWPARGDQRARWWRTTSSDFAATCPHRPWKACLRLCALLPPWEGPPSRPSLFEALRLALGGDAPITVEGRGPAFLFGERVDPRVDADPVVIDQRSAQLLERDFPYTCANLGWRSPVVAVIEGGAVEVIERVPGSSSTDCSTRSSTTHQPAGTPADTASPLAATEQVAEGSML